MATVLPWEQVKSDRPWILKMHGDREYPRSIVLTRQHFVRYDAATRPAGSILQALLLTRHVLIVGASLNDDNVSRLVYEVDAFRKDNAGPEAGKVGTMLDIDNRPARRELWTDQLEWVQMAGESVEERTRALEVFLDAAAANASSKAPWLLDKRFSELLDESEREWVKDANDLYVSVANGSPSWEPLRRVLKDLGAYDDR